MKRTLHEGLRALYEMKRTLQRTLHEMKRTLHIIQDGKDSAKDST